MLPTLEAESVDSIVTDPPAGIGFMGKTWDKPGVMGFSGGLAMPATMANRNPICRKCRKHERGNPPRPVCDCPEPDFDTSDGRRRERELFVAFLSAALAECYRVAKPGARMLCWAIPRTSHWTATAIEDAGWIIEDRISHLFGQGFPKAKSKLKPAVEDWWLARKPSRKVPPLQIDSCRVGGPTYTQEEWNAKGSTGGNGVVRMGQAASDVTKRAYADGLIPAPSGRWPANLVLSHMDTCREVGTKKVKGTNPIGQTGGKPGYQGGHKLPSVAFDYSDPDGHETVPAFDCDPRCPVRQLDEMSGERPGDSPNRTPRRSAGFGANFMDDDWQPAGKVEARGYADDGGASRFFPSFPADASDEGIDASRFFYCGKATRRDRNEGLEGMPEKPAGVMDDDAYVWPKNGDGSPRGVKVQPRANHHPTVKPTPLLRWLCRLITPPGGTILDPFMGSGSTGKAAVLEGFGFVGIEQDPQWLPIAARRIDHARGGDDTPLFRETYGEAAG